MSNNDFIEAKIGCLHYRVSRDFHQITPAKEFLRESLGSEANF